MAYRPVNKNTCDFDIHYTIGLYQFLMTLLSSRFNEKAWLQTSVTIVYYHMVLNYTHTHTHTHTHIYIYIFIYLFI